MNKMGISIETGNIKRNLKGPELRITITEMKNSLEEFEGKLDRISKPDDKIIRTTKFEEKKERKKKEQRKVNRT